MDRFVSKCVSEYGTDAPMALRSGRAPVSEMHMRVRGEYALLFVEGEFDFTVAEMVTGVFSCERNYRSQDMDLVRNAVCTPLAALDMLDMCVVQIEANLTRLVVRTVIAALLCTDRASTLACIPDALLVRIADLAMSDLRLAKADYEIRRRVAMYELESMVAPALVGTAVGSS